VHQAVRELYPNQKSWPFFSLICLVERFCWWFCQKFIGLDEIILLDIYPARELPMEGINSQWLMDKMINTNKKLVAKTI
jgi:UDP-N-acetylmuramate--alanine ligase